MSDAVFSREHCVRSGAFECVRVRVLLHEAANTIEEYLKLIII